MRSIVRKPITDLLVGSLNPSDEHYEIADDRMLGFSVRIGARGAHHVCGGKDNAIRQVRVTPGTYRRGPVA